MIRSPLFRTRFEKAASGAPSAARSSRGTSISRTRLALALSATLLGTAALPAIGANSAVAAATTLYVNNNAQANCTDGGTGTQAAPFCTVAAAAAVVQPGQTVQIARGDYPENDLTITRSGTSGAPITFRGPSPFEPGYGGSASIGTSKAPGGGLTVRGAAHVRFEHFGVYAAASRPVVLADGAQDVSFDDFAAFGDTGARITNGSGQVRYSRGTFLGTKGPTIKVDGGSTGTVVTTNLLVPGSGDDRAAVLVDNAPNSVVVANSIEGVCAPGIVLTGTSTGAVVENNVINPTGDQAVPCGGPDAPQDFGLSVAQSATAGTKADYNTFDAQSNTPAYNWAGTTYTDQASFTAASGGQGAHDFLAPISRFRGPDYTDHAGDAADETAPGMLPTDRFYKTAVEDPTLPDTGTGSGIRDRGAEERTDVGSAFTPSGPTRLLDTRLAIGVPSTQAVSAWGTVDLPVTGVAGVPASGVTAVTMTVTVTEPQVDGHLTVYPHGGAAPDSSSVNWASGHTIANQVTVPVKDGKVSFFNASGGTVHLVADLAGYYSPQGSLFHAQGPTRLLDTRLAIGVPSTQAVSPWGTVDLPVTGVAGVPASGVTAVTMNVTVTDPTGGGHLTVYPHGGAAPDSSNINWTAGQTIPNLVTVPVKDGKVSFYNASGGTVNLIADLAGYYATTGKTAFYPGGPTRIMDTRRDFADHSYHRPAGPVPAWGTLDLNTSATNGLPVTLNVTVTEPGAEGHLTVFPYGDAVPDVSNLNFKPGDTIANQVVVQQSGGRISLYNASGAPLHLVVDVFGTERY
ncbi:hypothetical protein J5Y04_09245 [Kitasatospora sp. RG8]|uniref:hypothetical protein n=1 Tax=Kitasatospora sp. RG8 TaxID=2820815 RepID=UPI001AE07D8C|nr:hypothetical protein [Kitasatospora sp. RG8]MBP0449736.1 hypothetical protein [Kitasatospora sp. RG8]